MAPEASENKEFKDALEDLVQEINGKKVKIDINSVRAACLQQLSDESFKNQLLPVVQRVVLRTPEIRLEFVSNLFTYLSVDLSPYAIDLGKLIVSYCKSKDEALIKSAVDATKNLASKCTDPAAIKSLINLYFGILNGSEGKLTILTQRMGIISGIGALSNHSLPEGPDAQALSTLTCDKMLEFLKSEVHEGTQIHGCGQMYLWCRKFTSGKMPDSLVKRIKEFSSAKNLTPMIKSAYIICADASLNDYNIDQATDLLPILGPSVQKAIGASVTQIPLVTEGLSAGLFFIKTIFRNRDLEAKHKAIFNGLMDLQKLPFLSEKFVNQANKEVLFTLLEFIERIGVDYETKLKETLRHLCPTLIYLTVLPTDFEVRKKALDVCRKLIQIIVEVDMFQHLMGNIKENYGKYDTPSQQSEDKDEAKLNVKALLMCVKTACKAACEIVEINSNKALINAFLTLHIPVVYKQAPKLWIEMLRKLLDQPKVEVFLRTKSSELCSIIFEEKENMLLQYNCLKTLVVFFPDSFMDRIITKVNNILTNPELKIISVEEFEIFKTPEGELWNKAVVEAKKDDLNTKNLKKESKLYSYKEQLAEIEIRKEVEAKKKKKNVDAEPQLNEKQKAAKKAQLEKESAIRSRLKLLYNDFRLGINFLRAISDGNKVQLACRMYKIVPPIINLLQAPLSSKLCCKSFIALNQVAFLDNPSPPWYGDCIAHITLRQLKPYHTEESQWTEDLNIMINRLVKTIHESTVYPKNLEFDERRQQDLKAKRFTASAISYCFPLFSSLILSEQRDSDLVEQIFEIIIEHTHIRVTDVDLKNPQKDSETVILKSPQYLPRHDMLSVLFQFMQNPITHLELLAMQAIKAIATCSDSKEGNAKASKEEILIYLEALKLEQETIRKVSLDSLTEMSEYLRTIKDASIRTTLRHRCWVARFDTCEEIATKAHKLWDLCDLESSAHLCNLLLEDLNDAGHNLRLSVADAMESLLIAYPNEIKSTTNRLMEKYRVVSKQTISTIDSFGRVKENLVDHYEPRLGIALVLNKIAPLLNESLVMEVTKFLIPAPLDDKNEHVQSQMLEVGITLADKHGKKCMNNMLSLLKKCMDKEGSQSGMVKKSIIIMMGTLARHLSKDDEKIKPIVAKLISALSTPSEMVQEAVANCLPPLIPAFKDDAPAMLKTLLQLLLESDKPSERRGAAHGIAGIIKGLGILSLKQLGITEALSNAIESKKNSNHREGALLAFERLCVMLGRLFEPYIIQVIPKLLLCMGDTNMKVRKAADDTAKAFMMKLGAHSIRLVLPSLLAGIDSDTWRTKTGSIELLGAMAYCAPKQLSSFLPNIVPKLMTVLSDSHPKVQQAGEQALKQIGSVIRNPEIQVIVPILMEALEDPANKTRTCLETMLNTKFVHFIDAPSLALIMPVIERAFQGRSTETRKMAAQIIGNMYSLTDQKDLTPYLSSVIVGLKQSLLDSVPEVRAVTARALGAMVKGIGDDVLDNLLPWLMETLTSDGSSVDRSGAAQGLAEVMGGLGLERLEQFMPEIITNSERADVPAYVRDGYIMLFIYLPVVFGKDFIPYIGRIINPILKALADENEFVRETALKAGQRIVNMYAETAIQLLLPELEQGLFDDNWRIRYCSVQLLGDLLYKISKVSGKMTTETADDDDNFGTEQSYAAIISVLGLERRNRVLSGLYMGRCDVTLTVRQAALHVWKIIVSNTPRTLKEIMPTLFTLLLGCLASTSSDKQKIAARTLGDIVNKLGERVLPEIIPILEQGLESDRPNQRQGVCIGLSEIISSTSKEMVQPFFDSLVPTVTKAIQDPLPEVRHAAAAAFESLHSAVGPRACNEIIAPLLDQLSDPDSAEYTLDGLKQIMTVKSRVLLPFLIPYLTRPPVNTRALAVLSVAAGDVLSRHIMRILPALILSLSESLDTPQEKQELECCQSVILAKVDDVGTEIILDHLLESAQNHSVSTRRAASMLLYAYCCQSKDIDRPLIIRLIRGLILLFVDTNEQVLQLSVEALSVISKNLDPKDQVKCLDEVVNAVRAAASDLKSDSELQKPLLPGFCLDKGITPLMPFFREALLTGETETKELAAQGLAEIIELTSCKALEPSVLHIIGTSIRILGDRYPSSVKIALLKTLALLIGKQSTITPTLRAFIPQLKQTFLKASSDPHDTVKQKAEHAMKLLSELIER